MSDPGISIIGDRGTGTLDILQGGQVTDTAIEIGQNPGSRGDVEVDGKGSRLFDRGNATIGDRGQGKLDIRDGGEVCDGATEIGQNSGSRGDVEVDGKGSSFHDRGNATIGDRGEGKLDITDGGAFNDTNGTVAAEPGSSGTVVVDGNGSQWNNSGTLDIGPGGSGVIDVSDGGVVVAGGGTTVDPNGTVIGDGTITTPTLTNNGTVVPIGPSGTPGILTEKGSYRQGSSCVLDIVIGGPKPSQAGELKINGAARLDGTLGLTSLNNFHQSAGDAYEILSATNGVSGKFVQVVDSSNTARLTRLDIYAPNGVLVIYLARGHGAIGLSPSTLLPATLTVGDVNDFLVKALDPTAEQLSSVFEIWFSGANTERLNVQNRFDDIVAGSTGLVSDISYLKPPATGKEVTENKGVVEGKAIEEAAPSPLQPATENRWGVWVRGFGDFVNVDDERVAKGYDFTTGGFTIGIDYRLTSHFVLGLMGHAQKRPRAALCQPSLARLDQLTKTWQTKGSTTLFVNTSRNP